MLKAVANVSLHKLLTEWLIGDIYLLKFQIVHTYT
jgi:hypothetical protein